MRHKNLRLMAYAGAILCCVPVSALAVDLRVILMAGQSNMSGSGRIDVPEFPSGTSTSHPEVLYTHDTDSITEGWGPLQARLTSNGARRRWFGPELGFGEKLVDEGIENVAIIKYSRSGTSLRNDWCPVEASPCENGTSRRIGFYEFVDDALAELQAMGHSYTVDGFIWVQGSGDAGVLESAEEYDDNLLQFSNEIDERYGQAVTVINRYHIDSARPHVAELRQSQRNAANIDPNLYIVHTDDLQLNSDYIHFSTPMHLEVGRRLAARYLEGFGTKGDSNGDGIVDLADYTVWRDTLGSISQLEGDRDGDGVVDLDDYTVWSDNFGLTLPSPGNAAVLGTTAAATVPEPGAYLLLVSALGLGGWLYRRR